MGRGAFLMGMGILGLLAASCYYDNVEELYPDGCQITDVSYAENIVRIMERECLSCHNNFSQQGGINLQGYENILQYVDEGSLLGSIKHEEGFEPMPLTGAQLSDCDIDRIDAWINDGAPDN